MQCPVEDFAYIGKITDEYNFSEFIFLSFVVFNPLISVNVYSCFWSINNKLSSSSFDAIFNNKDNFFNSSKILSQFFSFWLLFSLDILLIIELTTVHKNSYCFIDQIFSKKEQINFLKFVK